MFSDAPIKLVFIVGVLMLVLCAGLFLKLALTLIFGTVPEGYSTLLVLQLLNIGLMMTCMGVIGTYVRTTLNQAIHRPRAIISEVISDKNLKKVSRIL